MGPAVVRLTMQLGSISREDSSIDMVSCRNGFLVLMLLQVGARVIYTNALLNSGATTCFMDMLFAHTHSFQTVAKKKPILIEGFDGRPLSSGVVIEETAPL
jgi:hypothetical protein